VGAPIFTHSLSDNGQDPAAVWTVKRDAIEIELPVCHIIRLAALRAARLAQIPQWVAALEASHGAHIILRLQVNRTGRGGLAHRSPRCPRYVNSFAACAPRYLAMSKSTKSAWWKMIDSIER
jgi:hypothetical protein